MNNLHRVITRTLVSCGAALLAVTLFSGALATPAAAGPVGLQAAGGWYTESDEFFLNAGARFGAGTLTVIPNLDWVMVSDGTAYSLNVDGTMSVLPMGVANLYVGGGIGWLITDTDFTDSNTETVFNLIAGAGLSAAPMKPFAQFKYIVADGNDPLAFSIGVRF